MNSEEAPGLYVHIPFCRTKCPYCGFFSSTSLSEIPRWLRALREETLLYRGAFAPFDSLYLGGGTPSVLPEGALAALMESLHDRFPFAPDLEITLEANPDDVTRCKISLLRDLGVNRLSMGVQSFDERELTRLGRRHSARQAEEALDLVRCAGFDNIGIDLMFGLEGQTVAGWLNTLERAVRFGPEHLSCYQLTVDEGTPFAGEVAEGRLRIPGEARQRALFLATSDFLEQRGYIHYEISNFAKGSARFSRHNCKYWRHVPYLGIGPSAHSFLKGGRWWNVRSLDDYCSVALSGRRPVEEMEELDDDQMLLESLFLGFRTRNGVPVDLFARVEGADGIIRRLKESGLIEIDREKIHATRRGFLVADSLPLLFLPS